MYFVYADLGYDGGLIIEFGTLTEAQEEYEHFISQKTKGFCEGVALIEGQIIKKEGEIT